MEDALKVYPKPVEWSDTDPQSDSVETNPKKVQPDTPGQGKNKRESTDEKALDRWFREQRGSKRVIRRLGRPNELLVSNGGPLVMTGNITLINEDGSVTHANYLSLCRCGASKNKPLCDDQHLDIEFIDSGAVQRVSDWMPVNRPQIITVTCIKNGPLKFRGYLRIYNRKGQECITMSGALCRCGKSSKKPFCDSNHGCAGC